MYVPGVLEALLAPTEPIVATSVELPAAGSTFVALNELPKTNHSELVVLVYEYELLKSYGFGLRIFECSNCSVQLKKTSHYFSVNNSGFYCDNCLGEMKTNENMIKLSVESQVIFRSIERRNYKNLSSLDLDNISISDLSKILKLRRLDSITFPW